MSEIFKKNYINSVIFRIDYDNINLDKIWEFSWVISHEFSFLSPKSIESNMFSIDEKWDFKKIQQTNMIWVSKNSDNTKNIEIGNTHLFIEYKTYKNKDILLEDIELINSFLKIFSIDVIKRIWLRYVNIINDEKIKEFIDWNNYINENLLWVVNFTWDDENKLWLRYISNIHLKEDKYLINIISWIYNNDYPNQISKQEFILDYDCFSSFPLIINDSEYSITEIATEMNEIISKLFIKSIKQNLIDIMNG